MKYEIYMYKGLSASPELTFSSDNFLTACRQIRKYFEERPYINIDSYSFYGYDDFTEMLYAIDWKLIRSVS